MRLSVNKTNELVFNLEERKYGHRLNSMQLADKASVSLDYVNRVENQRPIDDQTVVEKIANALGITPGLLRKIAGFEEMSTEELNQVEQCLTESRGMAQVSPACEQIGLRRAA